MVKNLYSLNAKQGKNNVFYYLLTIFLVFVAFILGNIPVFIVGIVNGNVPIGSDGTISDYSFGLSNNMFLFLSLLQFVLVLGTLILCVQAIHKRTFKSVITGERLVRIKKIIAGAGVWFAVLLLYDVINFAINPDIYVFNFDLNKFLVLFLIVIVFIPIQSATEELLIRGYLFQGLSLLFKKSIYPIFITAIIFGLLHSGNPEVEKFGFFQSMGFYVGFGLFLAIIAVLDNGLEIPIGIHVANNVYGSLIVTFPDSVLQTDTVFLNTNFNIYSNYIAMVLSMFIIFVFFKYRYNWHFKRS